MAQESIPICDARDSKHISMPNVFLAGADLRSFPQVKHCFSTMKDNKNGNWSNFCGISCHVSHDA